MTAKTRPLVQPWNTEYRPEQGSPWPTLLVSGCSFTDNISMKETVTWPWYLKTLMGFQTVYDCSQSGAGNNHIYNSILNECETNNDIDTKNALVVVMWSSWSRADVIAHKSMTKHIHSFSNYEFSGEFNTLSLYRNSRDDKSAAEKLCNQYAKVIDPEAQVYETCLRIIGLKNYLENKKIAHVFLSWKSVEIEYNFVNDKHVQKLGQQIQSFMAPVMTLDDYARFKHLKNLDGHPSTEAHLRWSRNVLMPYLLDYAFMS
jgi:hypothetical protein